MNKKTIKQKFRRKTNGTSVTSPRLTRFKITVNASEYAETYRIAYLKEAMKYLQEKIEFLEMRYNKNYNNGKRD